LSALAAVASTNGWYSKPITFSRAPGAISRVPMLLLRIRKSFRRVADSFE
jgi:hypothetical protein